MAFRAEWLKTRQQLLAQVKRQVNRRLGREPRDLASYVRRYNAEFSRPWARSDHDALIEAIAAADVVLGADFHAFAQSQRIHLRVLRSLPEDRRTILALEAVPAHYQVHIDQFMTGKITESEFLQKVKWSQLWGFPWENYRPLFELAKKRGLQVVGINTGAGDGRSQSLVKRDRFCAAVISRWLEREPHALVYVIIGDLHLARGHLPAALAGAKGAASTAKIVTVLQNSEHLYFRLAKTGKEHQVEVLRAKGSRFCVIGSPPWVKWQSYLMYLEETYDRDLDAGGLDYTDYVASFVIFIARDLGLSPAIQDLSVVTLDQVQGWRQLSSKLDRIERKMVGRLSKNERSFFLPQTATAFLARTSINHASTLAGQFLHSGLCDLTRPPWRFPEEFEAQIWIEAIGFFCSKLINHKRKTENLPDLKAELSGAAERARGREVLRLALAQRLAELHPRRQRVKFKPKDRASYLEAARIVGHMFGDRLYFAVAHKKLPVAELVRWMQVDPLNEGFAENYFRWTRYVDDLLLERGRR